MSTPPRRPLTARPKPTDTTDDTMTTVQHLVESADPDTVLAPVSRPTETRRRTLGTGTADSVASR